MKPKFIIMCVLVLFSILFHYTIKHSIVNHARENLSIEKELSSEKAINKDLKSEYNDLQAYSRIMHIASTRLNMILPPNDPEKVQLVHDSYIRNRRVFTLIDFISPSAEALARR
jgi:cell division protein FtsL